MEVRSLEQQQAGARRVWNVGRCPTCGRGEKRSGEQNKRMWALLRCVAAQVEWYGQKMTAEEWKDVFSAGLKKQRVVPGLDGGFVILGARTSEFSKEEMGTMQELIEAFAVEREVDLGDDDA